MRFTKPTFHRLSVVSLAILAILVASSTAFAQVLYVTGGQVGIGTSSPEELLHLETTDPTKLKMRLEQGAVPTPAPTLWYLPRDRDRAAQRGKIRPVCA